MKVLLDTHAFLWWDAEPKRLSAQAVAAIQNSDNAVVVSVVSVWEMQIKSQLGKLTLRVPLERLVAQHQSNGAQLLPITLAHVLAVDSVPLLHKDPFDRLLLAQAIVEGAHIITADPLFSQYSVPLIW